MEGTYALPEAQRDRFMMRISMGYPDAESEVLMLRQRERVNPLDALGPCSAPPTCGRSSPGCAECTSPPPSRSTPSAVAGDTRAPRPAPRGEPRATLQLVRAAKVCAALDGREFVIPDDVAALVEPVFAHRLIASRGRDRSRPLGRRTIGAVLRGIVGSVRVPLATR
jgi:MoxR-like ATPase